MGLVGGSLGYWLLRIAFPCSEQPSTGQDQHRSLATRFGPGVWKEVEGETVIDFGCGSGEDTLDLARYAKRAVGVDIQEHLLEIARDRARAEGVTNVSFLSHTAEPADIIITVNSFEHFAHPVDILRTMKTLLTPGGKILISFGPTWYHPYGGALI